MQTKKLSIIAIVVLISISAIIACTNTPAPQTVEQVSVVPTTTETPTKTSPPPTVALPTLTPDKAAACRAQLAEYKPLIDPLLQKWNDTNTLAISTPRISVSPHVATLQELYRSAEAITPGACIQHTHMLLVTSMYSTIKGYLAFLADSNSASAQVHLFGGTELMKHYDTQIQEIEDGKREGKELLN